MSDLDEAAATVRRLRAEVISAETAYNFHHQMAGSASDELKKHRHNLANAEAALVKEAQKTPGAPVPGPRKNNTKTILTTKESV
jgi:hypothetical protein